MSERIERARSDGQADGNDRQADVGEDLERLVHRVDAHDCGGGSLDVREDTAEQA
jgi:hypothetical protein